MVPAFPPLQAILDVDAAGRAGWEPWAVGAAFLDGGARFIQIRAKHLPSGAFLQLCEDITRRAQSYDAAVIVNDRVDIAIMANAAGVHLGQDDLPVPDARRLLGPDSIVGFSTHSVVQIETAAALPVSYVAVGPVFATRSKETGYEAVGLELVREAARRAGGCPVVAIGGITLEAAPSVLEAGATSVAVIGDLLAGADPAARTRAFVQQLARYRV